MEMKNNDETHLTGIVLCKDADKTLRACLVSLNFCDQVILADDGSCDASTQIARDYNVKIIKLDPTESFAQKRNQTLAHVKKGWVLFVDSDEVISRELSKAIEETVITGNARGYFIRRRDKFLGKLLAHGEAGSMWLLRLAKFDAGSWRRKVHETWNVSGKVDRLSRGEIVHFPHPTLESFLNTINRYTDLEVKVRSRKAEIITWIQLFFFPLAKFIYNYVFKLGFLDGMQGLIHAYMMSLYSLLVRIKILEYVRNKKSPQLT